jgi:hypothetical protein
MRIGVSTTVREMPVVRPQGVPRGSVHPGEGPADAPPDDARPATLALRPGRVVLYAWLLAGLPIAALQVAHAGLHERHELPPLLHWLRDTSLAVPAAALAVTLAAFVVLRIRPAASAGRASLGSAALLGFLAAATFAVLAIPLAQVHGLLFGAEAETGMTPLQHALTEGIAVFQVALVLVPVVLVTGVPWRTPRAVAETAAAGADVAKPHPSEASADIVPQPAVGLALEGADR